MINLDKIIEKTLELAKKAKENDEVPVGAVIYDDNGNIIAESQNKTRRDTSVCSHAEMVVINQASKIKGSENLSEYNIASSLEPCAMCAQAIAWSKLKTVAFACDDKKSGGVIHNAKIFDFSHHKPTIIYVDKYKDISADLLKSFFKSKR